MKLQVPFIQLPVRFDAERLASEIAALGDEAWRPHPQNFPGNFSLPLISVHGDPASDAIAGPMRPTAYLQQCAYLQQVLGRLGAVWGRSRLMKLSAGAEVTPHADIAYYWRDRVRVHVPVVTDPGVRFMCGDEVVNMAQGECWIFDTWRPHRVLNPAAHERVHLVADSVGSEAFWELAARGRAPGQRIANGWVMEQFDGSDVAAGSARLDFESVNVPQVMTPWELRDHVQFILAHVEPDPQLALVQRQAGRFFAGWHALWARYGDDREGWPAYREALDRFARDIEMQSGSLRLVNGMEFMTTLRSMVLGVALADRTAKLSTYEPRVPADAR
jgi:hypothetical protein